MNKILIEIYVPAISESFEIFVPGDVPVNDLKGIIASGVVEITNGKYIASGCEQLCLKNPAGVLNPSLTLQDYGIKDGTEFYLI